MRLTPLLAIVPVILLAGCTPQAPTPTPTVTVTAPAPEPTEGAPAARTADTPLDVWDAYLACRNLTIPYFGDGTGAYDPGVVDYASFDESVVYERADGNFFVYIEVTNGNAEASIADAGAAQCFIGGETLGGFEFLQIGATIRLTEAEIAAAKDQSLDETP